MSVGLGIGKISYDGLNISDDVGGGVQLGLQLDDHFMVDLGFLYSRHYIDDINYNFQKMDQYNFIADLKYLVLPYRITPVVGASASYTRRNYERPYTFSSEDTFSDSIDVGVSVGLMFAASENLALSFDFRRMVNLDANYQSDELNRPSVGVNGGWSPIEELDYDIVSVSARFVF
jgi:hypothetical protein